MGYEKPDEIDKIIQNGEFFANVVNYNIINGYALNGIYPLEYQTDKFKSGLLLTFKYSMNQAIEVDRPGLVSIYIDKQPSFEPNVNKASDPISQQINDSLIKSMMDDSEDYYTLQDIELPEDLKGVPEDVKPFCYTNLQFYNSLLHYNGMETLTPSDFETFFRKNIDARYVIRGNDAGEIQIPLGTGNLSKAQYFDLICKINYILNCRTNLMTIFYNQLFNKNHPNN